MGRKRVFGFDAEFGRQPANASVREVVARGARDVGGGVQDGGDVAGLPQASEQSEGASLQQTGQGRQLDAVLERIRAQPSKRGRRHWDTPS